MKPKEQPGYFKALREDFVKFIKTKSSMQLNQFADKCENEEFRKKNAKRLNIIYPKNSKIKE